MQRFGRYRGRREIRNTPMPLHRTAAVAQAVVAVCLAAGAAVNAFADGPPTASAGAVATEDGSALFNPFGDANAPPVQARRPEPERPQGDWTLPLVAATAGFAGIGVLLRRIID
jgi:hypothetical protein